MTETEFIRRSEQVKSRLYRTAYLYLDGEHAAVDAVDEAVFRAFRNIKKTAGGLFFRDLDHPHPHQCMQG